MFVDLFKKNAHTPRLVIFAPIQCEAYVQTSSDEEGLLSRIKEGYASTFEFLHQESRRSNIAVVITPVQTLGSVGFARLAARNDQQKAPTPTNYKFAYEKLSPDAQYSPIDSDQPLRYLLRFLLSEHLKRKRNTSPFSFLAKLLISDSDSFFTESSLGKLAEALDGYHKLRNTLRPFADDCKVAMPFEIVQGHSLLLSLD